MRGATNRATHAFAQVGPQLDDVLTFAQKVGVFLLLAESLSLAHLLFQLAHIVLQMLDVQPERSHLFALLLNAFVARADAFPER